MRRPMRRAFIIPGILLLLFGPASAQTPPGTVLNEFVPSPAFDTRRTTFDDVSGRYIQHLGSSGGRYRTYSRTGEPFGEIDFSEDEDAEAFESVLRNSFFFFVENLSLWYIVNTSAVLEEWSVVAGQDGTAEIAHLRTLDFGPVLNGGCITALARHSDGTWYATCEAAGKLYHISPNAGSIIREWTREELTDSLFASSRTWDTGVIAVERLSGDLFLGFRDGNTRYVFRVGPSGAILHGRFPLSPDRDSLPSRALVTRLVGTSDGFVHIVSNGLGVKEYSLESQSLPVVTSLDFSQEGVIWTRRDTQFSGPNVEWSVDASWGDAAPGRVNGIGPVFWSQGQTIDGNRITGSFARKLLANSTGIETTVSLVDSKDQLANPQTLPFPLMGFDGDIPFANQTTENQVGKTVVWSASGVSPTRPFNGWVEFADFVPWVGGKRYGIQDIQASGKMDFRSKGDGSVAVGGGGSFLLGSGKLRTTLKGGALTRLTPTGLELNGGLVGVGVAGTVTEEAGLFAVFPQLWPLRQLPLTGWAFRWLEERAKFAAGITVGLDATTKFKETADGEIDFIGQMDAYLALAVSAAIEVLNKNVKAVALGEGKTPFRIVPNDGGFTLSEIVFSFLVSGKVQTYNLVRETQTVFTFSSETGPGRTVPITAEHVYTPPPRYLYETDSVTRKLNDMEMPVLLKANPFDRFDRVTRGRRTVNVANPYTDEVDVLGNIPSSATPSSSLAPDGTMMIVWEQPVPGNPATQATDIYYSYFNGNFFTAPRPLQSDSRMDFAPSVRWTLDGGWVAVWERSSIEDLQPTGDPEADNDTIMGSLIPAWSIFDPATASWSKVNEVPIDGLIGFRPSLLTGDRTGVTGLAWLESTTGKLVPWDFEADPVSSGKLAGISLSIADFSRSYDSFSRVVKLGADDAGEPIVDDILDYSIARVNDRLFVYIQRIVSLDSVSPLSGNIVMENWRMDVFSGPKGFQKNGTSAPGAIAFSPTLRGLHNGQFIIAESKVDNTSGPAIFTAMSFTPTFPSSESVTPESERVDGYDPGNPIFSAGSNFDNFAVLKVGNEIGVVYPGTNEQGRRNLRFVLDKSSRPRALQFDESLETSFSADMTAEGDLVLSYLKSGLERQTTSVRTSRGIEELSQVSSAAMGTIALTRHRIVTDLRVKKSGVQGGIVGAGNVVTVSAEIENVGDRRVGNVRVNLYAVTDDPTRGPIMETIVEDLAVTSQGDIGLLGNDMAIATAEWKVPDNRPWSILAIVDPDNLIQEEDEENNTTETLDPIGNRSEIVEHLLGRLSGTNDLDLNGDERIDAGDVLP